LAAGDLETVLATYEADAYIRGPSGGDEYVYRGKEKPRELYSAQFANGGGIQLEHCTLTDGVRCAIGYNVVRWYENEVPPQAGLAVYERGPSRRLTGARIYDAVEPPDVSDASSY
jgi:hypothetical protein